MATAKPAKGVAKKAPARKTSRKPAAAKTQSIAPKVDRFIVEYLIDLSASQAYVLSRPGMKITTARVEAARPLPILLLKSASAPRARSRANRLEMTSETLLEEVNSIVRADPRELFE